ncbi:T9SS type A sorting domain-containing protein [Fluviicola chungangensis]|uniref:T9SS type A sorting domain-containing protein n=1 Tax=Fluviicola chungangensis TaxID=2597671 RepID=A0A556N373_9FLAO|nr:T9SS type A sorting domain-containing protein [Fluviicola chungangensis]TSJ46509.1 T9SS type A sorting domain-containing protein [Fluviicola chungangensis]
MKKSLLVLSLLAGSTFGFAQNGSSRFHQLANGILLPEKPARTNDHTKTILCNDTLRYPQAKEQILGTSLFTGYVDVWGVDNESISQTFLNTGNLPISGIEFYGANNDVDGDVSVTVLASVYNVDASFSPTTLITSGTVTFSSTVDDYHYAMFPSPVTVTGNYAVVLKAVNPGEVLTVILNDLTPGQSYDELFAKFYSSYASYPNPNNWNTIPVFTAGNYNCEPLVAPIVSYNLNSQFTASATNVCLGSPVTFTKAVTPAGALSSRMSNINLFATYFGLFPSDSTYAYDLDNGSPIVWNGSTTYTYPAAGAYDVQMGTNGGFFSTCFDFSTQTITVNPLPAAPTITPGGSTTFCSGGNVVLTSSAATGNNWSNGATTQSITVNTAGTYTVTATASGCTSPASAGQTITVNPLDNATYTYPTNAICDASPNQTPTTSVAGTFSATPAGLTFVSTSTGEIDVANSTSGTYSITYSTSGSCPNTSTQTIVISGAPDASFTYAQSSYCSNGTDPNPVYGAGASAGAFSSTTGLVINSSTGVINLASSNAGTYTVTNTIAANGSCPADAQTFSVTIAAAPTAAVSGGGTQCGSGTIPVSVALTGSGPWDITYSDGTTTSNATGVMTSPFVINATANGTYTVTTVGTGACSAAGTGAATVVFNPNPTVSFTPVVDICDNAVPVTLAASPAGGVFSGSTGVSGSTFDPNGLTPGSITLTYNYTDANNCSGSATSTFTLNAAPTATLAAFQDVCLQAASFGLTGGLPAGGTYSGTGVSGGNFDPATAGVGSQVITYTATSNGCSDAISQTINVEDCAGIIEMADFGLEVYPNPASSVVTIKTGKDVSFSMISEDGKIVYPVTSLSMNTETQLEVSHLAKGIYFLHFNNTQGNLVEKVIVK